MTYTGSCHCGAVRFELASEAITGGRRCNCSICTRKGTLMSPAYYRAAEVQVTCREEDLGRYTFGDRQVVHCFCRVCGVATFSRIAGLPEDYAGAAQVDDYRINLTCVEGLDLDGLAVETLDGRSY